MTPEQKFSDDVRKAFARLTDYPCWITQVVEAGCPGPADILLEWKGRMPIWLEVKVRAPIRSEQITFLRRRWDLNQNSFLLKKYLDRNGKPCLYRLWLGRDVDRILDKDAVVWADETIDVRALVCLFFKYTCVNVRRVF